MSLGVAGRAWEGMDRLMGARGFKLKCQNTPLVMALSNFCEIILFHGHKILLFDDDRHVRGHLNLWTFKLNTTIYLNQHIIGILNLWIVVPMKYTKLNVQ